MRKKLYTLYCLLMFNFSYANNSTTLTMKVEGTIYSQPFWTVGGAQSTNVTYSFSYYAPSSSGETYDLDSVARPIRLMIPAGAPITTTLTLSTPSLCTVGGSKGTAIPDKNIKLVTANGAENASGSLSTGLFTQENQMTKLRFKSIPSNAKGEIACEKQGSLTYSF